MDVYSPHHFNGHILFTFSQIFFPFEALKTRFGMAFAEREITSRVTYA